MKTMNEFESVVAIAALILTACAILDLPFGAPADAGRRPPESAVARVIEVVQQEIPDAAANPTPREPLVASLPAADGGPAPTLLMQSLR